MSNFFNFLTFASDAFFGTTTVARTPSACDAYAIPSPWFPADDVITAPVGSLRFEASTAASAPRTLNAPVGCRPSIFTYVCRPRRES